MSSWRTPASGDRAVCPGHELWVLSSGAYSDWRVDHFVIAPVGVDLPVVLESLRKTIRSKRVALGKTHPKATAEERENSVIAEMTGCARVSKDEPAELFVAKKLHGCWEPTYTEIEFE